MGATKMKHANKGEAHALAQAIMESDKNILGILVSGPDGEALAYAGREAPGTRPLTNQQEIRHAGYMEFLGFQTAPRPQQDFGEPQYMVYVYENFKLAILGLKRPSVVVGLKLKRSASVDPVVKKILSRYR